MAPGGVSEGGAMADSFISGRIGTVRTFFGSVVISVAALAGFEAAALGGETGTPVWAN